MNKTGNKLRLMQATALPAQLGWDSVGQSSFQKWPEKADSTTNGNSIAYERLVQSNGLKHTNHL